ncbi:hypothetical protein QCA50_005453 [Cerrena zonata]|uniref:Fungal-type protein kinase domain-containing protein n=1 Tax=Cerrena zonata TaxID=2478898 RepID=A0AAW0GF09_9APHY
MAGTFVGAMPARDFLKTFLNFKEHSPPRLPKGYDFSRINGDTGESDMYEPLCEAITKVFPRFETHVVANAVDAHDVRIRPILAVVCKGQSFDQKKPFNSMDFWIEVKPKRQQDAFTHKDDYTSLENKSDSAKTREYLISYAAAVMSRQHRTCLFSLLICDHYVRFFRWDRSGCVVSELVDFLEHPEILAYFFLCYGHLSAVKRGLDTTATRPSEKEERLLQDALKEYEVRCKAQKRKNVTALKQPIEGESPWPVFKIKMKIDGALRSLIVRRPLWGADSPCGRATRGYLAYDLKGRKLVFLRDFWRTEDEYITPERIIYAEMEDGEVPFLPIVLAAGDVKTGRTAQTTVTQHYANSRVSQEWMMPCARLKTYVHCRVVQELAYPLASAVSSKEAVQAIRDVLQVIKIAYYECGLLHCDISTGNIMIGKNDRGVLNDWDHALKLALKNLPHPTRTGTWQFSSVSLLTGEGQEHEIQDDVESCFWVLLYIAFHYFKHDGPTFDLDFFYEYRSFNDEGPPTGGCRKLVLLTAYCLDKVKWNCIPLDSLLHTLSDHFHDYMAAMYKRPKRASQLYHDMHKQLGQVEVILRMFGEALALDGWSEHDAADDQMRKERPRTLLATSRRMEQEHEDATVSTFTTGFVTGNCGRSRTSTEEMLQVPSLKRTRSEARIEDKDGIKVAKRARTEWVPARASFSMAKSLPSKSTHRYGLRSKSNRNPPIPT